VWNHRYCFLLEVVAQDLGHTRNQTLVPIVETLGAHTHSKRSRTIAGEGTYTRPNAQRTNTVLFCIILPAKQTSSTPSIYSWLAASTNCTSPTRPLDPHAPAACTTTRTITYMSTTRMHAPPAHCPCARIHVAEPPASYAPRRAEFIPNRRGGRDGTVGRVRGGAGRGRAEIVQGDDQTIDECRWLDERKGPHQGMTNENFVTLNLFLVV
jgi:hypothetical protein